MHGRYLSFSKYLKQKYPFKVQKIPVYAGFTCPTRDGTKGRGGCAYCNNLSFSPNTIPPVKPLEEQIKSGMEFYKKRGKNHFIIYFQAYTNTHGSIEELEQTYDLALKYPNVVGLAIGTRPDCVPDQVLDLIQSYTEKVDVWLELGLQSCHNTTLMAINRGHTYEDFLDAVNRAQGRGFNLLAHLIYGLPGETWDMMMQTTHNIAKLGLSGIKLHHFYIAKDTKMEELYKSGKVKVMEFEQWVRLVCDVIERLPPDVVIQRVCGELHGEYLVAPRWGISRQKLTEAINEELARRDSCQGKKVD